MTTAQKSETDNRNMPVPVSSGGVPMAAGETSSSAIAAREKASVEARFVVAMNRPRIFDHAFARIITACKRPTFAKVARYAKPVGGKHVHGLSIRFAEEAGNLWGNIDVTTFLVFDDDERRIYRTTGTDLETNTTHSVDIMIEKFVERRVVRDGMEVIGQRQNTQGQVVYKIRATEDDLIVKVNNQIAKSRRNVILPLIPADVKEEAENQIIQTVATRDAEDPDGARKDIVMAFHALGVHATALVELLGHPLEQTNPAELTLLRSYYTALKDGETTWAEIAEAHNGNGKGATQTTAKGTDGLRETLRAKAAPANEKPATTAPKSAATAAAAPAGSTCEKCGGKDGKHKTDCPYFAD